MLDARYLSLVPVALLLGGALVLWLGGESMGHHSKYVTALAIGSVALISLAYLAFLPQPYDTTVLPWLTLRRLSLGWDYRGDGLAIYPSLFALGASLALLLFGWGARLTISAHQLALMLASLAAFVQLLLSGNLLLLYLSWEGLTLLLAAQSQSTATEYISQGARGLLLGFNQLPGLGLLLVMLLLGQARGNFVISMVPPAAVGMGLYLLIMVAGGARGGLYPLHAWLPAAFVQARTPLGGLLIILAPLAGLYLLARFLFVAGPGLGVEPWLLVGGFLSVVLLPFFALEEASSGRSPSAVDSGASGSGRSLRLSSGQGPLRALAYLVAAQGAFAVVALALGAQASLWRQMLSLALGASWFYMGWLALGPGRGGPVGGRGGLSSWLAWLGGLSLLGLPSPTVGFGARWELFNILWGEGHWLGLGLGLFSQAISVAVLLRLMAQTPQVAEGRWQPQVVLLFLGGLGVALGVVPGLMDDYVVTPALASLSLGWGPEPGGMFWNLALMVLALPGGLLLERYGQRPLLSRERGEPGPWPSQVLKNLNPFPLYHFGGQGLVRLARLVERGINLIPQQPPLATALMIGLFILFFMVG